MEANVEYKHLQYPNQIRGILAVDSGFDTDI